MNDVEQGQEQQGQSQDVNFDSMTSEQLEKHLDGTPEAAPANEQAPDKSAPQGQEDGEAQKGQALDPIARLEQRLEQMQREMGRVRGLQSNFDKLPQTVEQSIAKILQERERNQYLNSLSPEERANSEVSQRQEQMFRDRVRQEAIAAMQEQFPEQLQFLEQAREEHKDQQFLGEVSTMAEQMAPGSSQGIAQLFQKNLKELQSSDPEVQRKALAWNEQATSNPHFVVLELVRAKSQQVQSGAAQYSNAKAKEANKAGQGIRAGQSTSTGRKSVGEMSEAELNSLSTEELEKLLP